MRLRVLLDMSAALRCEGCTWELSDPGNVPWTPRQERAALAKRCPACSGRLFAVGAVEAPPTLTSASADQLDIWAEIGGAS